VHDTYYNEVPGKIMIVDGEEEIAQALGHVVRREGMTPLLAKRRREALELVRAGAPDYLAKPFEPS
jgi:DNA-binding response OmpR family regulator